MSKNTIRIDTEEITYTIEAAIPPQTVLRWKVDDCTVISTGEQYYRLSDLQGDATYKWGAPIADYNDNVSTYPGEEPRWIAE